MRDLRNPSPRHVAPWSRANSIWLAGLIALLPLQFVLLRFGDANGKTDLIGVVITIFQWMLLTDALKPRGQRN